MKNQSGKTPLGLFVSMKACVTVWECVFKVCVTLFY